jgi:hypothetical protein
MGETYQKAGLAQTFVGVISARVPKLNFAVNDRRSELFHWFYNRIRLFVPSAVA